MGLITAFLGLVFLIPGPAGAKIEIKHSPLEQAMAQADDIYDDFGPAQKEKEKGKETLQPTRPVSKYKALMLSLLLPGAGQYYAGEKGRAEVFFGAEALTWAGAAVFHTYGKWKEDDYVRYAEDHAGIEPAGKDDDFYKNLTFYDNRDQYNTDGRIINPGSPYYPHTAAYYWQWDSRNSQDTYRTIRNASKSAFRKATFLIGVAVFNRVISAIDAFRVAKKVSSPHQTEEFSSEDHTKVRMKLKPFGANPQFGLAVTHSF